ncbi:SoxR reducing system RseC family protein [SAR92 clade bacterium H921]|nr:SoxR reducing system RseC family protein [SAR92 clade bacterium H921]
MIIETGTVISVESDSVWVETIARSTCDACSAQKGCGQRVLSQLTGETNRIRVLLNSQSPSDVVTGQSVTIGIPEDVIVVGSMLVYMVPILASVIGAWIMGEQGDAAGIVGAAVGLLAGGMLVSLQSRRTWNDLRHNPVLLQDHSEKRILDLA